MYQTFFSGFVFAYRWPKIQESESQTWISSSLRGREKYLQLFCCIRLHKNETSIPELTYCINKIKYLPFILVYESTYIIYCKLVLALNYVTVKIMIEPEDGQE